MRSDEKDSLSPNPRILEIGFCRRIVLHKPVEIPNCRLPETTEGSHLPTQAIEGSAQDFEAIRPAKIGECNAEIQFSHAPQVVHGAKCKAPCNEPRSHGCRRRQGRDCADQRSESSVFGPDACGVKVTHNEI